MNDWWNTMPVFEKVFWFMAIPFSVVFIVQTIATFAGLGDNMDDADGFDNNEFDTLEGTFRLFTVKNFIIFFTVFGWSGITLYNSGANQFVTVLVSALIGIIVMLVIAGLFYFITRLAESGNIDIKQAVGSTGQVYIPIPANQKGKGKIHVTFKGSFLEADAVTKGKALQTGESVKIVETTANNIFIVEKI